MRRARARQLVAVEWVVDKGVLMAVSTQFSDPRVSSRRIAVCMTEHVVIVTSPFEVIGLLCGAELRCLQSRDSIQFPPLGEEYELNQEDTQINRIRYYGTAVGASTCIYG